MQKLACKVLHRYAFFANAENVLLAMLADDNEEIYNKVVLQVLAIRKIKSKKDICGRNEESFWLYS